MADVRKNGQGVTPDKWEKELDSRFHSQKFKEVDMAEQLLKCPPTKRPLRLAPYPHRKVSDMSVRDGHGWKGAFSKRLSIDSHQISDWSILGGRKRNLVLEFQAGLKCPRNQSWRGLMRREH